MKLQKLIENIYPLSPMQQGMLFHVLDSPGSGFYFNQLSCSLEGDLDRESFRQACQRAVERHTALRTCFLWQGRREPLQAVLRQVSLPWRELDWRGLAAEEVEDRRRAYLEADRERGFDLAKPPLVRVALARTGETSQLFFWSHHHLVMDGWSLPLIFRDLFAIYRALAAGREPVLPPSRPFGEYVAWLRKQDRGLAEDHWRRTLAGYSPPPPLRLKALAAAAGKSNSDRKLSLSRRLTAELKALGRRRELTLNTLLQGAWGLLLSRYQGRSDVVFGETVSGRPPELPGVESMVGLFINTLPVRLRAAPRVSLLPWLAELQQRSTAQRRFEYSSLVDVQGWSDVPRGTPLFESILVFENFPMERVLDDGDGGLRVDRLRFTDDTHYPLTLTAVENAGRLDLTLSFAIDRFDPTSVERMLRHLRCLLTATAADPRRRLSALPLLSAGERAQVLVEWNDTGPSEAARGILERLAEQVDRRPEAVAAICGEDRLSFRELGRRAARFARHLGALGVGPEDVVAVCLEPAAEVGAVLLGIWEAGAAYLPLDPDLPRARRTLMLRDAGAKILVTRRRLLPAPPAGGVRALYLDGDAAFDGAPETASPPAGSRTGSLPPERLAYVLFTSGSTGRPKGVGVHHRGLAHHAAATGACFALTAADRVLQFSALSFDVAAEEMFPTWLAGASVVFWPPRARATPVELARFVAAAKVTVVNLPASYWQQWVEALAAPGAAPAPGLRLVVVGSESVPAARLEAWKRSVGERIALRNAYGLTETTITSLVYAPPAGALPYATPSVPVGRPLANMAASVLGPDLGPTPAGAAGELHLSGPGLARAYLGRPRRTAERFLPDPSDRRPGGRLFRTGDLARHLPDGNLEILGRVDHQVKIRGFRIELGEIETLLRRHEAVREAVAVAHPQESAGPVLVAWLVAAGPPPAASELRELLAAHLPAFMVPAFFVPLESLPLTAGGKVDRAALARRPLPTAEVEPGEFRTPFEEIVAGIWAQVLGRERVSAEDDFFALGGHSLLAIRALSRLRETFGIELPMRSVFEAPTARALAIRIEAARSRGEDRERLPLEAVDRGGDLPLSFAQQRLWFLDHLDPGASSYNVPSAVRIRGPIELAALAAALAAMAARHETLRTRFPTADGRPRQEIQPPAAVPLPVLDLGGIASKRREALARRLADAETRRPFDLDSGPLLRVALVRLAATDHVLLLTLHHIISDGWSMEVLVRELVSTYAALLRRRPPSLPELPVQYADFAHWQRRWLHGERQDLQLDYWRRRLADAPAVLQLPADRPRPAVQSFRGGRRVRALPPALGDALARLGRERGATFFMAALAAFQVLLSRYSGQQDLCVGTPIANRNHLATENLIGFFVNTLVLRATLEPGLGFRELLGQVRESTLEAYAHQDVPFEKLVDELQPERHLGHNPLFQVMFLLQDETPAVPELPGCTLSAWEVGGKTTVFDLILALEATPRGFGALVDYSTDLFDAATIHRLLVHFECLLAGVTAEPDRPIAGVGLLSPGEGHQMLVEQQGDAPPAEDRGLLHELFEARVARAGEAVALCWRDEQLSYRELDRRAGLLAHRLRALEVGPEVPVGVLMERCPETVVAMLGTLKAGGAYVPLDPRYPRRRLEEILAGGIEVLLTAKGSPARVPSGSRARVLRLDAGSDGEEAAPPATPGARPQNLAYLIFTSGSTGRPKGVMVPHGGIVNTLRWRRAEFALSDSDRILQNIPLSFDPAGWQIFGALVSGARLILARPGANRDTAYLLQTMAERRVTVTDFPPTLLRVLLEDEGVARCSALRYVFAGGEALPEEVPELFERRLPAELYNVYGPTEVSVDSTFWKARAGRKVAIGRPISGRRVYLLDAHLQPLPIGVPGEILLGGRGLARGYLADRAQTAERFIPHPLSDRPGRRLYRSGDLARRLADGEIEFLGRIDQQLKVRGFRIEPAEIEKVLLENPGIREAFVTARAGSTGSQRLIAYLAARPGSALTAAEARHAVKARLPEFMVPSAVVILEALPRLASGKVDARSLPAPGSERPELEEAFAAPRNPVEERLAAIWSAVLGIERVGAHDNFFELGGDSILSIQIVARAHQQGLRLQPRQVFEHQTIAELAAVARPAEVTGGSGPVTGAVPLTPIQRWFFEQSFEDRHHFNQAFLAEVRRPLEPRRLAAALAALLRHHDALRHRFFRDGDGWRQVAEPPEDRVPLVSLDLSALPGAARTPALERAAGALQRSLHLTRGPLLRVAFFDLGRGAARLLVVVHHMAVDGVSWRILLADLQAAYEALEAGGRGAASPLPAKTTPFQRWARGLVEYAASPELRRELPYWQARARRKIRPLPLERGSQAVNDDASARSIDVFLTEDETRDLLREVPRAYRAGIQDALLTALAEAIAGWTGEQTLLVELEGHGREEVLAGTDLSRTVGWFTTLYPLLLDLEEAAGDCPGERLKAIKEQLRRVPRQGIGHGLLLHLSGDREVAASLRRLPEPQIVFNYHGRLDQALPADSWLAPATEDPGPNHSRRRRRPHLLEIGAGIGGGRLHAVWTYSENLHRRSTVEALAAEFLDRLRILIRHCRTPGAGGYTPSDFPLAGLDQPALDRLLAGEAGQVEDLYPLTPMQEGMLFHTLLAPDEEVYYQQLSTELRGPLDVPAFRRAWRRLLRHHQALRTVFLWQGLERPLQKVCRQAPLPWRQEDWREEPLDRREARFRDHLRQARRRGFDPARPPLMDLTLIRWSDDTHRFVWSFHHGLLDGWSTPLVLGDVFTLYRSLRAGRTPELAPRPPFRDYVAWLETRDLARAETFWRRRLAGFTAPTPLPEERRGGGGGNGRAGYGRRRQSLSAAAGATLQGLAQGRGWTLNTLCQAAWALLLAHYSGEREVLFGVTVSGRPAELPRVEAMVGLFINTLPFRTPIPATRREPLEAWLDRLQEQQIELEPLSFTPLLRVQEWSQVPRGTPLFESLFLFENYPQAAEATSSAGGLEVVSVEGFEKTNYPLTITVQPAPRPTFEITYDRARFEDLTVARMLRHLEVLAGGFADHLEDSPAALGLLGKAERHQVLREWNDRRTPYPADVVVSDLFAHRAERVPEAVAAVCGDHYLSYRELHDRAEGLARRLGSLGVGPEVTVGICLEHSLEMLAALLAVWKVGGAYVPASPELPRDRLAFMLESSRARVVVARRSHALPEVGGVRVDPGEDVDDPTPEARRRPPPARSGNLAYVIFTSGSTGRPKGVQVSHRAVVNFLESMSLRPGFGPGDVLLAVTTLAFDISVLELLLPLVTGGRVVLVRGATAADGRALRRRLAESRANVLQATPASWRLLVEAGWRGSPGLRILCGGEALTRELADRLLAGGHSLWNMYGPTETTVWSAIERLRPEDGPVTIGRPIANTRLHVLDGELGTSAAGAVGELLIGGDGLSRGYFERPALTAATFLPDPLGEARGGRLYRTGDLARYRGDGTLECLGRRDHQVKVHGFRIELGEIEATLAEHPAVSAAVAVLHHTAGGEPRLAAYWVPSAGAAEPPRQLRGFLAERLPSYMLPGFLITLPDLPLTPSGKVDRRALPAPQDVAGETPASGPPRDTLEWRLVDLWRQVLEIDALGVRDDFFAAGGNSLLALRLLHRIGEEIGGELQLSALLRYPTVERLAAHLRARGGPDERSALVAIKPAGSRPPFFCVHPLGGGVLCYAELARALGDDQPFYGLEMSPGHGGPDEDLADLASRYVAALRRVAPAGPYLLGGWSFGGVVAFEMARQLRAAGDRVALLAIVDALAPAPAENAPAASTGTERAGDEVDELEVLASLVGPEVLSWLGDVEGASASERLARAVEEGRERGLLPPDFDLEAAAGYLEIFRSNARRAGLYAPRPFDGRAVLFQAAEIANGSARPGASGWRRLARGGVEVHTVSGTHHTLLGQPHVQDLAGELRAAIERALTASQGSS